MLGRKPTMPLKLAGLRRLPPMSEPCASQAMPVASATAAPPEEPAAARDVFQGLRVAPNTSLDVLAPAPDSAVLDIAWTIPPSASRRPTRRSEFSGVCLA